MSQERSIPVSAAKEFAERHGKAVAVLVGYDPADNRVHVATYGVAPTDKQVAAEWGELCAKAIGCGDVRERYVDFRATDRAQWAKEREQLCDMLKELTDLASSASSVLRAQSHLHDDLADRLGRAIVQARMAASPYHRAPASADGLGRNGTA